MVGSTGERAEMLLFTWLPAELMVRMLCHNFSLLALPRTLRALQLTSRELRAAMSDEFWYVLSHECPIGFMASATSSRRSLRIARTPATSFAEQYNAIRMRTEAMHHALACHGQDSKSLAVGLVRKLHERWKPVLIDRVSPVYYATLLMECCRSRVKEGPILQSVKELIQVRGADASAQNEEGLNPLIIAAARGLSSVVGFLLQAGADASARGVGRFRLCGTRQSVRGRHSALEWVELLIGLEAEVGVPLADRQCLHRVRQILRQHEASRSVAASLPATDLTQDSA